MDAPMLPYLIKVVNLLTKRMQRYFIGLELNTEYLQHIILKQINGFSGTLQPNIATILDKALQ